MDNEVRATGALPLSEEFLLLFTSKYKKRILKEISLLEKELLIIRIKSKMFKEYDTAEIVKAINKREAIEHDLNLYKKLLK